MGMPATTDHYWIPADLEQFPEGDGCKYECIDGVLLVTPAPRVVHMAAQHALQSILARTIDSRHGVRRVIVGTADLNPEETAVVQPDLFVIRAPATAKTPMDDPSHVLLIAEVASPSTARTDRTRKRALYQRAGVPEYWIVDVDARSIERWTPDAEEPDICRDTIDWTDPVTGADVVIDLPAYFASVWGESTQD